MNIRTLIFCFLLLLVNSMLFSLNKEVLARAQFNGISVNKSLKEKVPFLQQDFSSMNHTILTEKNIFTLIFKPSEYSFLTFTEITGISLLKARFTVSWYTFTNASQIPSSTKNMLNLVNTQKPVFFSSMDYINGKWATKADLPYYSGERDVFVYAYIAYPNIDGVLVPLAGQSFYADSIAGETKKVQEISLNGEMLRYWQEVGYL